MAKQDNSKKAWVSSNIFSMQHISDEGNYWLHELSHRVHTEWQWSLSSVHSIMMEKLALAASTIFTITDKVTVYAPAERADTLPPLPFHLYPCVVDVKHRPNHPSPLPTRTEITTCPPPPIHFNSHFSLFLPVLSWIFP